MAFSAVYDQYEDPGIAFSDTQVAAWKPKEWMAQYVKETAQELLKWRRRESLPKLDHPWVNGEVVKRLWEKVTWNCTTALQVPVNDVLEVASIYDVELPALDSAEGKALTKAALDIVPLEWLAQRQEQVRSNLTHIVTVWRRQASVGNRPAKADRSYANKFVHCLVRELSSLDKIVAEYETHPDKEKAEANSAESGSAGKGSKASVGTAASTD